MLNLKSIVFGAAIVFAGSVTLSSCGKKGPSAEELAKIAADSTAKADSMARVAAEEAAKKAADSLAALKVTDLLAGNADLSSLVAAVGTAGLTETLKGGAFTVFAPKNDVLAAAKLPTDAKKLADVLKLHVVVGALKSADLTDGKELETAAGKKLKVTVKDGVVTVGGVKVVTPDAASNGNGVVHVIEGVIK